MDQQLDQMLSQAFDLIEADKLEDARQLLTPLLDTHSDDPDLWWLYAHAVTDADSARHALQQVLRIDPGYQSAAVLIEKLNTRTAITPESAAATPSVGWDIPEPDSLPDLPNEWGDRLQDDERAYAGSRDTMADAQDVYEDDDFESMLDDDAGRSAYAKPGRQRRGALMIMAVLGVVLVAVIVLAALLTSQPSAPTPIQVASTLPSDSGAEDFTQYYEALQDFNVKANGVGTTATSLGNTLVAQICTARGAEMRQILPQIMDIMASLAQTDIPDVDAIATHLLACEEPEQTLLFIGVPLNDALAYAKGDISSSDFSARWKPL